MLQIRQLEAFRAVVETGTATSAARQLGISQPAVSRLLASLSKSLGFEVLGREGGRMVPTQEAWFLVDEIDRVLDGLENIERLTRQVHSNTAGHLRIACLPGFATTHLPQVVAQFLKKRPGVTMALEPDRPERILDWIIGHQCDLGISADFRGHPAIEHIPLMMRSVCILPPGHRLIEKQEITPEDLDGEPFIHPLKTSSFYERIKMIFDAAGAQLTPLIQTRQFGAACKIVANGVGVSIVSEIDALEYADEGLVVRPFTPIVPHRLAILYPTHTPRSIITMEFIEAFVDSLKPYRLNAHHAPRPASWNPETNAAMPAPNAG